MTKKQAIHEWERAFGEWHEAGNEAWKLAQHKISQAFPNAIEHKLAIKKLEAAKDRLVRALDGL